MFFSVVAIPNIATHFAAQKNFLTFLEILIHEFSRRTPRGAAEKVRFITIERPVNSYSKICNRNAVRSFAHFRVSGETAFNNDIIHVLFSLSARVADSAAMSFELLNFSRAANERVNRHRVRAFRIADNVILAKEFNVIRAATLLEFCANSGCAHVNNGFRAGIKAVFSLNREFDGQGTDGSSDVFHSFFPFCAYSGGAALF
jgi:hypothetical protein